MSALDLAFPAVTESDTSWPVEILGDHLSPSSITGFWKCPEQWRRERIDKQPWPVTSEKLFGSAFHKAAEFNFAQKIQTHEDLQVDEMRDRAGDAFNEVVDREKGKSEIIWGTDKPNVVQQQVIEALVGTESVPGYHQILAPKVQPIYVERRFRVLLPIGVYLEGRIDVEDESKSMVDLKTTKRAKTQVDLDKDDQATCYLWAREQEGDPADRFEWQVAIRTQKPQVQQLETTRTVGQLAAFERSVEVASQTINHYLSLYGPEGPWPGATPLAWWCAPSQCSFYATCPWRGGA